MRKKGLVERILMSEPAEHDFSTDKLPSSRAKLFLYMLKNKFPKIYKNRLCIALFVLPLVACGILTMPYTDWFFSLDAKEGITHLFEYWFTVYVTAIPLWTLAFVGLAGGLNLLRKLAWSDPVVFKSDFLKGVKDSGRQMALIGLVWGIAFAIMRYTIDWLGFYYRVFDNSLAVMFGMFLCYFVLLAVIGYTVYLCCTASLYNVNLTQLLIGAFKLYFTDLPLATGVIVLSLSPILILLLLGYAITSLIAYILTLCLYLGIMIIPMMLVCHHTFDRVINKKDYPDYYGRGLSYGVYAEEIAANEPTDEYEVESVLEIENDFERVTDDKN